VCGLHVRLQDTTVVSCVNCSLTSLYILILRSDSNKTWASPVLVGPCDAFGCHKLGHMSSTPIQTSISEQRECLNISLQLVKVAAAPQGIKETEIVMYKFGCFNLCLQFKNLFATSSSNNVPTWFLFKLQHRQFCVSN
jgi:hypothetical protein